jgi:hypothetical protein
MGPSSIIGRSKVQSSRAFASSSICIKDPTWQTRHDIITLDESWFYLNADHESIWLPPDETVPERERHTVQSEKLMLAIVWNSNGFRVINVLSRGIKFSADHYFTDVLIELL